MKALFEIKGRTGPRPQQFYANVRVVFIEVPDEDYAVGLEKKLREDNPTLGAVGERFRLLGVYEAVQEGFSYREAAELLRHGAAL